MTLAPWQVEGQKPEHSREDDLSNRSELVGNERRGASSGEAASCAINIATRLSDRNQSRLAFNHTAIGGGGVGEQLVSKN